MAKNIDDAVGDGRATKGHNVGEMKKIIVRVAHEVIKLEGERAEVQAAIREKKAEVKGCGVKMVDFNAALRLLKLEDEDRNESIDNLKLCFEALGIGAQGDFFPVQTGPTAGISQQGNTAENQPSA